MEALIYLLIIVFISGSVVLFFLLGSLYAIVRTKVPWAKTPRRNFAEIFLNINIPKNSLIYDLGCGDGGFLFFAEKMGHRAIGYELSVYPFLKCLLKKLFSKSAIKIKRKNFFKENLKDADLVFVFLVEKVMKKLGDKLMEDLKPGTIVISYGFKIPGWEIEKILNTIPSKTYFYKT
jgi:SAM-dependent methyltransferase